MPTVGLCFPPEPHTLALLAPCLAACEHLEVMPETLWAPGEAFATNALFDTVCRLVDRLQIPVLGHSIDLCTTTSHPKDRDRQRRWLDRLAETHRRLPLAWITEHSGATVLAGDYVSLPVAVPYTTRSRDVLRARLDELQQIVGRAGIEHSALYGLCDPPEAEPAFLAATLDGTSHGLVLDLHNLVALERNHHLSAEDWLAAAPLDKVIELHLAGGKPSDRLPVARRFHLDSHDAPVPERVWELLDSVLPRLPALQAITIERLEGTIADEEAALGVLGEIERAKAARCSPRETVSVPVLPLPEASDAEHQAFDELLAQVLRSPSPAEHLAAGLGGLPASMRPHAARLLSEPDALRLTQLLVAQLRFSRLLSGSPSALAAFEAEPAAFVARFRAYHERCPPRATEPIAEAAAFAGWLNLR